MGSRSYPPSVTSGHPDFDSLSHLKSIIMGKAGGEAKLKRSMPQLLQGAIDFVIDPVRTARNSVVELDNVEKTFIGLKVEHFLRDMLNVPSGLRDLKLDGIDVDVKNTVGGTWTIPPETYRNDEPCILIAIADAEKRFWLGLIIAKQEYLTNAGNRDGKKSVSAAGLKNILWLVEGEPLPKSKWTEVDLKRFREIRLIKGGSKRAAAFFRENLEKCFHRAILETLLHDQHDYMKRLRENGGARDILAKEGILLFSTTYNKQEFLARDFDVESGDYWCAVRK